MNGADAFPADPNRNYAIPAGNPFAGAAAGADEVWLSGLRNPWRASFDPATGDLWIGDVGQGAREEIDVVPPRHLLDSVSIEPGMDVLDVATGTGNVALRAAALGAQVIGRIAQLCVPAGQDQADLPIGAGGNFERARDAGQLAARQIDQVQGHAVIEPELVPRRVGRYGLRTFVEPDLLHRDQHARVAHRHIRGGIDMHGGVAC